jgi:triacylglycerol lipase
VTLWQLITWPCEYLAQFFTLLRAQVYQSSQVPHGTGEPVLLIPGFLVGDWTLRVMAGWLSRIGYYPYLSGIDWNIGPPQRIAQLLAWRLDHIVRETGRPVIIVGHSSGGLLGRFLGAYCPQKVCHVVALGSPIYNPVQAAHPVVGLTFRALQALWRVLGYVLPEQAVLHDGAFPLPQEVGFTAIFSKHDEVVDWRTCLDPQGENREVTGRHVSLIVNREVYRILAQVLAACSR